MIEALDYNCALPRLTVSMYLSWVGGPKRRDIVFKIPQFFPGSTLPFPYLPGEETA
jgi:hypothetical protein